MSEKNLGKKIERPSNKVELESSARERQDAIREMVERKAERGGEKNRESSIDKSRERAQELAKETEKSYNHEHTAVEKVERVPDVSSKASRAKAYDSIMLGVQEHLPARSRAFSKVIHNPVVERTSEVAGQTIARPNAVLGGSMMAFVVVLAVFLVARHYGYPLSGSETMVAFALGWVLGIIFDYLRVMITGRRSA